MSATANRINLAIMFNPTKIIMKINSLNSIKTAVAALITAAIWCTLPAPSHAAEQPFDGIYSIIDPVTGETKDVMKIWALLDEYVVLTRFTGDGPWTGPLYANVMGPNDSYASPPLFKQAREVSVLALEKIGHLYHTPGTSRSRIGQSDTGYLGSIDGMGISTLYRRPLLTQHRERGERGEHDYQPQADDLAVAVTTLNYSGRKIQLGISAVGNPANAVDTDPLNAYMSSAASCCFYLPAKPAGPLQIKLEYRWLPDGKPETRTLNLPAGDAEKELLVVVRADGTMALAFPDQYRKEPDPADDFLSGNGKAPPLPPPAQRKALLAAELVRQKRFLNDLVALTDKPDASDEPGRLSDLIDERQQIVSYLEAFSACQGSLKKCDEQARAAVRRQ